MLQSDTVGMPDKATVLLADTSSPGLQTRGAASLSSTDHTDFENAPTEKRWLWIFKATEGTHHMRGAEKKEVVLLEYMKLRSIHHGQCRFEDKIRDVEAVGYAITDLQKHVALVNDFK